MFRLQAANRAQFQTRQVSFYFSAWTKDHYVTVGQLLSYRALSAMTDAPFKLNGGAENSVSCLRLWIFYQDDQDHLPVKILIIKRSDGEPFFTGFVHGSLRCTRIIGLEFLAKALTYDDLSFSSVLGFVA